ncbi:MAG: ornithine carbamoyltransferase [Candidatus Latescibacterota bacterium]
MKKDLVSISDVSADEIASLFSLALAIKAGKQGHGGLPNKTLAMIFEKPSLRTRVTFETGMTQMGGHAIYLGPTDVLMGKRESVPDVARNLSRWVDGIMARTFSHQAVVDLARHATVPVINALTDRAHPCQALAFGLTMLEHCSSLKGLRVVFVGDGNNVAHSLMLMAPKVGMDFVLACPEGYQADDQISVQARRLAEEYGTVFEITEDPLKAVRKADVIYADVWASMGQEEEQEIRSQVFRPYQINRELLREAKEGCLVTHCLPAHRGEEITGEILDGPQSIAFDEAENRLHIQKAIMLRLMG